MMKKNELALLMLCSDIGLTSKMTRPLSPVEWWKIAPFFKGELQLEQCFTLSWKEIHEISGFDMNLCLRINLLLKRSSEINTILNDFHEQGIEILTIFSSAYPQNIINRMGTLAPPLLFYVGNPTLLSKSGLSITGIRDVDSKSLDFAEYLGYRCAAEKKVVFSGFARGVDQASMLAALRMGGESVGIIPGGINRKRRSAAIERTILNGNLTFVTPYHPLGRFTPGKAKGRNRIIYAMGKYAVVVAAADQKGGTWTGASEALRLKIQTIFVRMEKEVPAGNPALIKYGATPLPVNAFKESSEMFSFLNVIQAMKR